MTILASRAHTCVHPKVTKSKGNKDEGCRKLTDPKKNVDGDRCIYYQNFKKNTPAYENYGFKEVWDIEDMVKSFKRKKMCPYYGVREIKDVVDIVFCPYNYLIDPKIRSSMNIDLDDNIVIVDEAHNIEDVCRSSTNSSISKLELDIGIDSLRQMIYTLDQGSVRVENAYEISQACQYFLEMVN